MNKADKQWHEAVVKKANYQCQKCMKSFNYPMYFDDKGRNQYVCGHHLKSKKAFPELRHDVSNGMCICFACHELLHRGK